MLIIRDKPLTELLQRRGAVTAIALATGVSRSAVSQWRKVPDRHLATVARITGKSPKDLRPDLFRKAPRVRRIPNPFITPPA